MRVVYSGYYGTRNSGDDAFCEVAAWGASKFWHADEHLFFSRGLPKLVTKARCYSPHSSYLKFACGIKDLFKSDIFVSAGGSTFHSKLGLTDMRTYAGLKSRIAQKGKVGAIGISLGPYKSKSAEGSIVEYLKRLDFLALRDQTSYEIALSYNLPISPVRAFDLAALLPQIYIGATSSEREIKTERKIIGIAACNYERYAGGNVSTEVRRNKFIADVLTELGKSRDFHFRFFVFNGHAAIGDEKLTYELISSVCEKKGISYDVVPYLGNVKDTYLKINGCDLVLATRLHAGIFSCYGNTPFFLLEYHRKCSDFLDDVGHDLSYRVNDGDVSVSSTCNTIRRILCDGVYIPPRFLEETKARSLLNFTETI